MLVSPAIPLDGALGKALWRRGDAVLPGGSIYFSRSADFAGRGVLPGFIASASGCTVTDVDGRQYIDFMGANGPNLLGYHNEEVDEAFLKQLRRMNTASLFSPSLVEIVERLVNRYEHMDWGVVAKNGSEVVSLAGRTARQQTGRRQILAFVRAYHGNDPELALYPKTGPLADLTSNVVRLPWNDAERLNGYVQKSGDSVAAILLNPVDQNSYFPTSSPNVDFLRTIAEAQTSHGIQLILDDVRHGFRLHQLGSQQFLGLSPDLITLGKALGNGFSVAALLGREKLRAAAAQISFTSTYMFEAAPMKAAEAVLHIYDRDHVFEHIYQAGARLREGIVAAAAKAGHKISYTGPVTMPTLIFEGDEGRERGKYFSAEAARRGAILHPALNWNLSLAHTSDVIEETIAIASESFEVTPI